MVWSILEPVEVESEEVDTVLSSVLLLSEPSSFKVSYTLSLIISNSASSENRIYVTFSSCHSVIAHQVWTDL